MPIATDHLTSVITSSDAKPNVKQPLPADQQPLHAQSHSQPPAQAHTLAGLQLPASTASLSHGATTPATVNTTLLMGPSHALSVGNHLEIPGGNNNPNLLSPDILNQRRGMKST